MDEEINRLSIKIHDKMTRLREEKGIDAFQMPKSEFAKWVRYFARHEENKK